MDEMRFKQIAVAENGILYGLAEDGTLWICKVRVSTDNGAGLKLGELLKGWEKNRAAKGE